MTFRQDTWATPGRGFAKRAQVAPLSSPRQVPRVQKRVKFVSKINDPLRPYKDTQANPIASVDFANAGEYRERNNWENVSKSDGGRPEKLDPFSASPSNAVYNFNKRSMLTALNRFQISQNQALLDSDYIYKSIIGPPSEKIEMYTNDGPRPTPSRSHMSPILNDASSGHSNDSGGQRYKSRQTANTKVVQVGPKSLPVSKMRGRGVNGFFPPVKLRDSTSSEAKRSRSEYLNTPPFMLELAPEDAAYLSEKETRTPSAKSSAKSTAKSDPVMCNRHYMFTPPVYPHVVSDKHYNDLTLMPKPRMMTSRGELPWVFRQKVKRSMNELSKIMTSKPQQSSNDMNPVSYRYY